MTQIPGDVLAELRSNLARLAPRDPERCKLIERTALTFNRSQKTVYRQLAQLKGPPALHPQRPGTSPSPHRSRV